MKNKFRQYIVIGVIAIVGTMGYNLIKKMKMFDL